MVAVEEDLRSGDRGDVDRGSQCSVEVVCVGNELLIGKTLNTNAHWLTKEITKLGGHVKRITTVGDYIVEIAEVVKETIRRRPRFILTMGGLGPTHDDKTLQGVAKATGCRLELDHEALDLVKSKYRELRTHKRIAMTKPRKKMATIPEGGMPIYNPVGTAPGVHLEVGHTTIFCLPGVPSELKGMFNGSIAKIVEKSAGGTGFYEENILVVGIVESALSPLIDRVMRRNRSVYLKSHPKWAEGKSLSLVGLHFSSTLREKQDAKAKVRKAIVDTVRSLSTRM